MSKHINKVFKGKEKAQLQRTHNPHTPRTIINKMPRRDDATRTSFRPLNAPKYGLRKHEYRRTAEMTLRYKGEEQDIILVPFMYSKSEGRYLIKISDKDSCGS